MDKYRSVNDYKMALYPRRTEARLKNDEKSKESENLHVTGSRLNRETRNKIKEEIRSVLA